MSVALWYQWGLGRIIVQETYTGINGKGYLSTFVFISKYNPSANEYHLRQMCKLSSREPVA